jgi:hypothetical protein
LVTTQQFEDTNGVKSEVVNEEGQTIKTKGQTTIYKALHRKLKI